MELAMKVRYLVSSTEYSNYTFETMSGVKTYLKTLSSAEVEDEVRVFKITPEYITQLDFDVNYNDEFEVTFK